MPDITFFIPGLAAPGGSKRAFAHKHTGRIIVTDDCKRNPEWRSKVADRGSQVFDRGPLSGPLATSYVFVVPRPKGHFGSGRNARVLKPSAPKYPTVKPDLTKLVRAAEDALNGIAWHDDSQVVTKAEAKRYGPRPGLHLTIRTLE